MLETFSIEIAHRTGAVGNAQAVSQAGRAGGQLDMAAAAGDVEAIDLDLAGNYRKFFLDTDLGKAAA